MKLDFLEIESFGIYDSHFEHGDLSMSPKRTTDMFEVELPLGNSGTAYIDGDEIPLDFNTIILSKPGQIRYSKLPFKCYYIHFSLAKGTIYDQLFALPNTLKPLDCKKYYAYFRTFNKYVSFDDEFSEAIIYNLFFKFVHSLLSDAKEQSTANEQTTDRNHITVQVAKEYIRENMTSDLSLENVAEHVKYSPIHFHQIFKNITGTTLHKYIEDLRIEKAVVLLTETDFKLTQIAHDCGFSSQSYFNYAFKRKMNKTPKEYARELIENSTEQYK